MSKSGPLFCDGSLSGNAGQHRTALPRVSGGAIQIHLSAMSEASLTRRTVFWN